VEQYGAGEAYLPVLEALARGCELGRTAGAGPAARADLARAAAGAVDRPGAARRAAPRRGVDARADVARARRSARRARQTRRSSWFWKTCTGATRPPSTCSRCRSPA
jgi:hypothetical protein